MQILGLIKLNLAMHVSVSVFRAPECLGTTGHMFLEIIQRDLTVWYKKHLIILNHEFYRLHPAGSIMFKVLQDQSCN